MACKLLYSRIAKDMFGKIMKNQYLLKTGIGSSNGIIYQDNSEVMLERLDSVFAKLFYRGINHAEVSGLLSHVKGLNIISKKSLFQAYGNDEAIKKYNKKANVKQKSDMNQVVLEEQKHKTQILYNHLKSTNNITHSASQNKDFFDVANSSLDSNEALELNENLAELKDSMPSNQDLKKDSFMTLVNPYKLRKYSFTIPEYITLILNITKKSKIFVYCPLDLASPLESSEVNYLFPIVFNTETKFAAQIPLSIMDYPDFNSQKLKDIM